MDRRKFARKLLDYISIVGSIASVLAFLGVTFVWPAWMLSFQPWLIFLALGTVVSWGMYRTFGVGNLAAKHDHLRSTFPQLHGIYHEMRTALVELEEARPADDNLDEAFVQKVLDRLADIFRKITGARCAICIKTFLRRDTAIVTLARDAGCTPDRTRNDLSMTFTIGGNTAFREIVEGHRDYFLENDLPALAGLYENENPNWRKYYQSTMVLPIRCQIDGPEKPQIFGFLCVDSLQTGIFEEEVGLQVGACVADMLCVYFSRLDALQSRKGKKQRT